MFLILERRHRLVFVFGLGNAINELAVFDIAFDHDILADFPAPLEKIFLRVEAKLAFVLVGSVTLDAIRIQYGFDMPCKDVLG